MDTLLRGDVEEQIIGTTTPNGILIGFAIVVATIEETMTGGTVTDESIRLYFLLGATNFLGQRMCIAFNQGLGQTCTLAGIIVAIRAGAINQLALGAHIIPIATQMIIKFNAIHDDAAVVQLVCLALGCGLVDASLLGLIEVLILGTGAVLVGLLVGTVVEPVAGLGITYPFAHSIRTRQATLIGVGQRIDTCLGILVEERVAATARCVDTLKVYAGDIASARFGIGNNGVIAEQGAYIIDALCLRAIA